MRIPIQSAASLGAAIRAVRRSSRVRIDDLAATAGVSKQFTQDVEHGKPTVQFGRVLKLLAEDSAGSGYSGRCRPCPCQSRCERVDGVTPPEEARLAAMRTLIVYLHERAIGTLAENNDPWAFEYNSEWVELPALLFAVRARRWRGRFPSCDDIR
jgi:transcriptional regulator with XRE-family HTH domain